LSTPVLKFAINDAGVKAAAAKLHRLTITPTPSVSTRPIPVVWRTARATIVLIMKK
jgi:hypothetical protein